MNIRLTPVASAVAFALAGGAGSSLAQTTPQQSASGGAAQTIEITGIRGSIQSSLNRKKAADTRVDVITAEDIGKMPDKNVADSLQRVPGVTISSAGATEGGFDENDRVSMRGTNPSLTYTIINGHPVASGDWFVLNQSDNAGRSVSYTLLPSELVSRVEVRKTSEASLIEGGVVGTVDIITRKPLDFTKPFTFEAAIGAVHATLPDKTSPTLNALMNWRNDSRTVGVLLQVFSEKRHLRRDGVEVLGYDQVQAGNAALATNPDLLGVWYPRAIGAALFEQERERQGALVEFQVRPVKELTLGVSAFYSKLDAKNYNRNYLLYTPFSLGAGRAPNAGYTIRNNTLVSASFSGDAVPGNPPRAFGLYDQISRPDEAATTDFVAFDADWRVNDALSIKFKAGTSRGEGKTPTQDVAEWAVGLNTGHSWRINGIDSAPDFSLNTSAADPSARRLDWIFGLQNLIIKDKDTWAQIDAEYALDVGVLDSLKFGLRAAGHDRESKNVLAQGPRFGTGAQDAFNNANWPSTASQYPGNFGSGLGGNFPRNVWYFTQEQMSATAPGLSNRDPVQRRYPYYEFELEETFNAGYVQANLQGAKWRGNVGVRFVQTKEKVLKYIEGPAATAGSITSAFGSFIPVVTEHTYTDTLPSFNLRYEFSRDLVGRLGASKTLQRPDYSALAGGLNLSPPPNANTVGSGSGSNPDLQPIRSTNFDATIEWYHQPRGLLSAGVFHMDLKSYVGLGNSRRQYPVTNGNPPVTFQGTYDLTVPVNTKGKVKGVELAIEQPLFGNFGISANYTYTDAEETGGRPLVGASRHTGNLVAFYEDARFNARVAYNYRSKFYSGLDRATAFNQDDTENLNASFGVTLSDRFSISVEGRNLNNPKLKYYALNEDQPRAIYQNGRQYYLTFRAKL